jgi:DnaJ-class molecular chaperone
MRRVQMSECPECNGRGEVWVSRYSYDPETETSYSGYVECSKCEGKGHIEEGVSSGSAILLAILGFGLFG